MYRNRLPQIDGPPGGRVFLTDSGLETVLIFLEGIDLPLFAAFVLLDTEEGTERLRQYFLRHTEIARAAGLGFVGESPTWRASPVWATRLGFDRTALDRLNRRAIELLADLRADYERDAGAPFVISGCVGPRGDGYSPNALISPDEAERYHAEQIGTFAATEADMVTAITMTHAGEAIGVARAARSAGMPVVISFTVETDGRLPSGQSLADAIAEVDDATGGGPAYYMVNCAHPTHFEDVLAGGEPWAERIRGLRANASTKSHAELDAATELDAGDPADLGARYAGLRERLPNLNVLGGCCGTDHRHIAAICGAWRAG
jgi:S-methylmethionine-dependent homocysteine/selenocysteine methylase